MGEDGSYEVPEQRLRAQGGALEFGVELGATKPRVVLQFGNLHELMLPHHMMSAHDQPDLLQRVAVVVVEFIAVAVAFFDDIALVGRVGMGTGCELTPVLAKPHGASHILDVALL